MSADLLRRAAALMRERAEACVSGFEVGDEPGWYDQPKVLAHALRKEYGAGGIYDVDAEHIASWHPAVALAVADWLDETVRLMDPEAECPDFDCEICSVIRRALAVVRAYLGESA